MPFQAQPSSELSAKVGKTGVSVKGLMTFGPNGEPLDSNKISE